MFLLSVTSCGSTAPGTETKGQPIPTWKNQLALPLLCLSERMCVGE